MSLLKLLHIIGLPANKNSLILVGNEPLIEKFILAKKIQISILLISLFNSFLLTNLFQHSYL